MALDADFMREHMQAIKDYINTELASAELAAEAKQAGITPLDQYIENNSIVANMYIANGDIKTALEVFATLQLLLLKPSLTPAQKTKVEGIIKTIAGFAESHPEKAYVENWLNLVEDEIANVSKQAAAAAGGKRRKRTRRVKRYGKKHNVTRNRMRSHVQR